MKKNQVADLSSMTKNVDKSPSANNIKKKDENKKQKQNSSNFTEMTNQQQSGSQKSDQENLMSGSPQSRPKMQKLQSQETSNNTNLPQPPKIKKKIKSILASEEQNKKSTKTTQPVDDRKDHFGVVITKGPNKHYKICFNPQIEEVYEVENWKEYNKEEKCNIFQMTLLAILAM